MEFNFNDIKNLPNSEKLCKEYLESIIEDFKLKNKEYNELGKILDEYKSNIKLIFKFLNIDNFQFNNTKITKTVIDKSYLDPEPTIRFLKDKGFDSFVKTKEYFDENELIYAIQNNQIDGTELIEFKIEKNNEMIRVK